MLLACYIGDHAKDDILTRIGWATSRFAGSWASSDTINTIAFFTPSSETTLDQAGLCVKKHSPGIF